MDTASSPSYPLLPAAAAHEQSLWSNGPVDSDDFYQLPEGSGRDAPVGAVLKVEASTDIGRFNIPPGTALSRFWYQSQALDGRTVPATAYILWPYAARRAEGGKIPVVAWAHGTSGMYGDSAPSHFRNLLHHFAFPFPLALSGYAVVAPDYAGLGASGVLHEYICNPAAANDIFWAVKAAQAAFDTLAKHFVAVGHSQGGGAVWGLAQRLAQRNDDDGVDDGYLGGVAVCPVTNVLDLKNLDNPLIPCMAAFMAPAIKRCHPEFDLSRFFTAEGLQRWQAYEESHGGVPVGVAMLVAPGLQLVNADWQTNLHVVSYVERTRAGGKPIAGPLLVVQGAEDPNMTADVTRAAVEATRAASPNASLQYIELPGMGHDATCYASQGLCMDWIAARFASVAAEGDRSMIMPARPLETVKRDIDWFLARTQGPFDGM